MARPKAEIDWRKVDSMLEAGCTGTEVSSSLGINPETLYRRCEKDNNMGFSEYLAIKRASGDRLIKMAQFDQAVKLGDRGMLVWLGKQRLGQKDKHDVTSNDETVKPSWTVNVVDPKKED